VLVARSGADLEKVRTHVARHRTRVVAVTADLAARDAPERVAEQTDRELGQLDVLVNNAGLERVGFYEDLRAEDIEEVVALNLTAPMLLTRRVLPGMLARNRGHVLNVASIAGLGAFAFGETYGASKHGLVGFTRALRASLKERRSEVSASVLCPGFVSDTGMYQEARDRYGVATDRLLGTCTSDQVVRAALQAIERDEPEVVVNSTPIRHAAALGVALPRAAERVARVLGFNTTAHRLAERRRAERPAEAKG
jgi:short-subunit dehydrogenase